MKRKLGERRLDEQKKLPQTSTRTGKPKKRAKKRKKDWFHGDGDGI